ncbi:hypothetical protein Tco_1284647 [Tanacetum coccineum]
MVITHCLIYFQVHLLESATQTPPTLKDPQFWTAEEKKNRKIDRLARSLLIQGLPNDIYSLIDSNDTAQELWDALERQMRGSEYGEQDRKAAIFLGLESSSESDPRDPRQIWFFTAKMENALSDSEEISSSAEETIAEVTLVFFLHSKDEASQSSFHSIKKDPSESSTSSSRMYIFSMIMMMLESSRVKVGYWSVVGFVQKESAAF